MHGQQRKPDRSKAERAASALILWLSVALVTILLAGAISRALRWAFLL